MSAGVYGKMPKGGGAQGNTKWAGSGGKISGGGGGTGTTKSAGSSGGKKGLVTSPFAKPIAGRKISGGRR